MGRAERAVHARHQDAVEHETVGEENLLGNVHGGDGRVEREHGDRGEVSVLLHSRRGYFYYIDEKDVALALKMEEVFYRHGVFYEFAVPTMMYCLNKQPVSDCIGMRSRGNESCLHAFPVDYSSESEVLWTLQRLECCVCLRAVSHQNDHLFLPPAAILFSVSFFLPFHSNSLSPPSSDGVPNSVCGAPSRFPHQGVHFKDHHYCVFKVRNGPSLHLTLLTILSPPPRQNNTMISALLLIDAKGKNIVSRYYRYCTSPPSLTR